MNKVILSGRPTRDPEIRYTADQMAIARFTLAVDRRGAKEEGKQSADFPSIVAFSKTASFIESYVKQGTKINVIGRIQTGSYTNKDGAKVYTTEVVAEEIEFAESKKSENQGVENIATTTPDGFIAVPDGVGPEGLPF